MAAILFQPQCVKIWNWSQQVMEWCIQQGKDKYMGINFRTCKLKNWFIHWSGQWLNHTENSINKYGF